ncbi:MAG: indole-3-glycerol-phosphate synthase TrpC, partial [Bacteroidales bacterium]|nr:indole-3-glycerol-phosphate synthase TrpC [Bacteroidales bacterium]
MKCLEILFEVHSVSELNKVVPETDMLGVNNRHLGTFVTDVQWSFDIADK